MKSMLISLSASVVTLVALAVFTVTMLQAVAYDPNSSLSVPLALAHKVDASSGISSSQTSAVPKKPPGDYPSKLVIPSIGVDAHIQYVGVTATGNLGTPNNFTDVAWYDDGTLPGDMGSALIDGHVDNGLGLAGVFKNLDKVKVGDTVSVVDENGSELDFVVTSTAYYDYQNVPVNDLFNENDGKILRLITCGGTWVPAGKTYNERLVVTAVLKSGV